MHMLPILLYQKIKRIAFTSKSGYDLNFIKKV